MLRRERLELKTWWNTLGQWGPTKALLERFDKDSQPVLQGEVAGLINQLVREHEKFDPKLFIQRVLPAAADGLSAKQFTEGLELASRLSAAEINPTQTLQYGLPALAQNANSLDSFKTNLLYLEALVTLLRDKGLERGKPFFVAVRTAARDLDTRQFTTSLVLATRLAEQGIDPAETLRFALPAVAIALNDQQFRLAISLANHAVRRGAGVNQLLGHDLPLVAREIAPDQLTTGLRVAINLEEKNIKTDQLFKKGLQAIVDVSNSPEEYQQNIDLLATLLIKLKRQKVSIRPPIRAMASGCQQGSDFRDNVEALYRFCQTMLKHGVVPDRLLVYGFPPAVAHTPETFQNTLQILTTVVVRLREAGIDSHLLGYITRFALDRVAKSSGTADEFRDNLLTLMKSVRQLAMRDIEPSCHAKALQTIEQSSSFFVSTSELLTAPQLLQGGLAFFYEMAANAHFDWRELRPTLIKEMALEAIELIAHEKPYSVELTKEGPKLVPKEEGLAAFRSRVRGKKKAEKH